MDAKVIFGLKIRQLRKERGMSFSDLAQESGLSASYLNEIEKGKKFPKEDKINLLAKVLKTTKEELLSTELKKELAPIRDLLHSHFLNELPLELFGIDKNKLIELIAEAPARVGAFVSALVNISQNYALSADNFYFAAMRAYQELYQNYFGDLEQDVQSFLKKYQLKENRLTIKDLESFLNTLYHYKIDYDTLKNFPDLKRFRSVYVASSKKLFVQDGLADSQILFQFAKELGRQYLGYGEQSGVSTILKPKNFDEVLNNFRINYFAVALLVNEKSFLATMRKLFDSESWNPSVIEDALNFYGVSPDILLQRASLIPKYLGLDKVFFFRMIHNKDRDYWLMDKELHLHKKHHPQSNSLNEHYCHRWVAIRSIQAVEKLHDEGIYAQPYIDIQRSQYYGTNDEYLCISIARPANETLSGRYISTTIGIFIDEKTRKTIRFSEHPDIPTEIVNVTCERCSLSNCQERVAPPIRLDEKLNRQKIQDALKILEKK